MSSLHDSGLFLARAVLVGTNAFLAYQNVLGIRWSDLREPLNTDDVDFAQFSRFLVGMPVDVPESIKISLKELSANPLFSLGQKKPALSGLFPGGWHFG